MRFNFLPLTGTWPWYDAIGEVVFLRSHSLIRSSSSALFFAFLCKRCIMGARKYNVSRYRQIHKREYALRVRGEKSMEDPPVTKTPSEPGIQTAEWGLKCAPSNLAATPLPPPPTHPVQPRVVHGHEAIVRRRRDQGIAEGRRKADGAHLRRVKVGPPERTIVQTANRRHGDRLVLAPRDDSHVPRRRRRR